MKANQFKYSWCEDNDQPIVCFLFLHIVASLGLNFWSGFLFVFCTN
jgi:hypothetical protein